MDGWMDQTVDRMNGMLTLFIHFAHRALGNKTRCIVNVDEIKIHSNEDGTADKTRSDLYMHFVNPEDNSILEVDDILRLVDMNIESLDDLFKVSCCCWDHAISPAPILTARCLL